jgi:hypothetical protein
LNGGICHECSVFASTGCTVAQPGEDNSSWPRRLPAPRDIRAAIMSMAMQSSVAAGVAQALAAGSREIFL